MLREHIADSHLKARDLPFPGERGGILAGSVIRRAWGRARKEVLAPEQHASPLGRRVYDLRHTCLTRWLNEGGAAAQVAEWAGDSVEVLLRTYARVVRGQATNIMRRIETALDISAEYPAGP
ncbi:site-specific integrase [Streptacidiphilus fuscans]|uniref:hypothetical protein n=1 Tax=Streptacidiphilus fuscans TaxID=2789292 RepID=UPI001F2CA4BA|nr:hypothetical protein [Streptacidiphilus fuscans]